MSLQESDEGKQTLVQRVVDQLELQQQRQGRLEELVQLVQGLNAITVIPRQCT